MKKGISQSFKAVVFFIASVLVSSVSYAQLEKLFVETYYISANEDTTDLDGGKLPKGSVTYRVYADLKPNSKIVKIYGSKYHPFSIKSTAAFFNNIDGQTYARDIKKSKYSENTIALDTYLTLGQVASSLGGRNFYGVPKRLDNDSSFVGGANNDGGSAAVDGGMLKHSDPLMGLPLTRRDGIDTMTAVFTNWTSFGIKDFISGNDSTAFGSLKKQKSFTTRDMFLANSGAYGVNRDSNYVLLAQLTTAGQLSFEMNLEVLEIVNGSTVIIKYVANDSLLEGTERKNRFLKYPFEQATCGCNDTRYLEYREILECVDNATYCKTKVIFGCNDKMACNYDSTVNFSLPSTCCYPGSCQGRDIAVVCPIVRGDNFEVQFAPNPNEGATLLNLFSGVNRPTVVKLFDYAGNKVFENDFGLVNRITNYELNFRNLNKGLFFAELHHGSEVFRKILIYK